VVPPALRGFAVSPLDLRVVSITVAAALASAALAGTLPALAVRRLDVLAVLQRGQGGHRAATLRNSAALVSVQAAFGAALVVGAASTVPGFLTLLVRSPGFEARDLFVTDVNHGSQIEPDQERAGRSERVRMTLQAVRTAPHVMSAAAALTMPMGGFGGKGEFWKARGGDGSQWAVSAGLFQTLRTPIRAGRDFTEDEVRDRAMVAMVSEAGARFLWPRQPLSHAVGQPIDTRDGVRRVVGVVGDIRGNPGDPVLPSLYLPITADEAQASQTSLPVVFRMTEGAVPDRSLVSAGLSEAFGPAPRLQIESLAEQAAPFLERPRFLAVLFGSLAIITLALGAFGLYAVASFEVARRRYEMGVRAALGASRRELRRRVYQSALRPVLIGVAIGLVLVWLAARVVQTLVAEVAARDPWIYGVSAVVMIAAAACAAWGPARRASRIDAAVVLRES
jgi:hypothetical protein